MVDEVEIPSVSAEEVVGQLAMLVCRDMDFLGVRRGWTVPGWRAADRMGSFVSSGRRVR
jgi:hypothetical protein